MPEIGVRAKEMMKLIPANHTERKFTGGRDSISIIMTTYNSMNIMLPSIFSILKQTHSNLELVIVDDCSTDGTIEVLNLISQYDSRLRCFNAHEILVLIGQKITDDARERQIRNFHG